MNVNFVGRVEVPRSFFTQQRFLMVMLMWLGSVVYRPVTAFIQSIDADAMIWCDARLITHAKFGAVMENRPVEIIRGIEALSGGRILACLCVAADDEVFMG